MAGVEHRDAAVCIRELLESRVFFLWQVVTQIPHGNGDRFLTGAEADEGDGICRQDIRAIHIHAEEATQLTFTDGIGIATVQGQNEVRIGEQASLDTEVTHKGLCSTNTSSNELTASFDEAVPVVVGGGGGEDSIAKVCGGEHAEHILQEALSSSLSELTAKLLDAASIGAIGDLARGEIHRGDVALIHRDGDGADGAAGLLISRGALNETGGGDITKERHNHSTTRCGDFIAEIGGENIERHQDFRQLLENGLAEEGVVESNHEILRSEV